MRKNLFCGCDCFERATVAKMLFDVAIDLICRDTREALDADNLFEDDEDVFDSCFADDEPFIKFVDENPSDEPCFKPSAPLAPWKVCEGEAKEDPNKVFGVCVRVDEPRREDYDCRWKFERDHEKFDRLVDAAEACDWENKSNTAPLHKVDAIRRRLEDGPVFNKELIGETHWW